MRTPTAILLGALSATLLGVGCTTSAGQRTATESSSLSARIEEPDFSHPTRITNAYLPFAEGGRWIYRGKKEGKPYLVEVAVTPGTRTVRWRNQTTQALVVRHRGWVRGRLIEEAFDFYAQGDDGKVWYLGEEVDNYRDGKVVNHEGSWIAGVDGARPGLLMPSSPRIGQEFVSENIPRVGMQRDRVVSLSEPARTPAGRIEKGLLLRSIQPDGTKEEKVFAPGIGEVMARSAEETVRLVERLPQDAESATTQEFSQSTVVDNPYFGVSGVDYRLYFGRDEGEPLRIEVALTGKTKPITWEGGRTETVVSQFLETSERGLLEIAVDWFAQDDAGNVWYFGENVWNYEKGRIADTAGSWKAGVDGPPGMIMPGNPRVGQRFNPENIPGKVFETVDVQARDATYDLPTGERLRGVLRLHETLDDGTEEFKLYGPGYGNVSVKIPSVEKVDIVYALPNDAIDKVAPRGLRVMLDRLRSISVRGRGEVASLRQALTRLGESKDRIPPILKAHSQDQLEALGRVLEQHRRGETRLVALDLEQTVLDIVRLYKTKRPVDLDTLDLLARRVLAGVDAGDRTTAATVAAIAGGVSQRSATILPAEVGRAAAALDASADDGRLSDIAEAARRLQAATGQA